MSHGHALRFGAVAALLAAGFLAGAQLGKIAPLADWYREAGFSLAMFGWLVSAIGVFVAAAALPAAFAVERLGLYPSFVAASLALAAGGAGLAVLTATPAILAARLVEGAGYLLIVIAAPALLTAIAPERLRAPVLALWSGFVPIGFAIASFLSDAMLPASSPSAYLGAMAGLFAAAALAASLLAAPFRQAGAARISRPAPSLGASLDRQVALVAAGFGLFVAASLAFFAFLPAYAAEAPGLLLLSPGVVVLLVPLGNVLASLAVAGRDARFAARLSAASFTVGALTAVPLFASADSLVATGSAVLFAVASGIMASALFASIPSIVPASGSAAVVIGVVSQAGGIATVAAPPLAGYVAETRGWPGLGVFAAAVCLAGLLTMLPLVRRARPR